jgi:hypothetical protein
MTNMTAPLKKAAPSALPKAGGADLARRQIERALAIAGGEKHPLASKVAQAAISAGA